MKPLTQSFIYHTLSRVNAAYPPRRRKATAAKHARCIAHLARYIENTDASDDDLRRWAAYVVLQDESEILVPPGYTSLGEGSLRLQATDRGGVEAHVLQRLAEVLIPLSGGEYPHPEPRRWLAWSTLFPLSASIHTLERPEDALEEWELQLDAGAYWLQLTVPDIDQVEAGWLLSRRLGLCNVSPGEITGMVRFADRHWSASGWLSDDPEVPTTVDLEVQGDGAVPQTDIYTALRDLADRVGHPVACDVNWSVDYGHAPWRECGLRFEPAADAQPADAVA